MRQELQSPEGKWKWMIHPPTPRLWPSRSLYYCSRGDARETRLYLTGWKVRKCCLGMLKTPLSNSLHSNSAVNFLRFPRKTFPWRLAFLAGKRILLFNKKVQNNLNLWQKQELVVTLTVAVAPKVYITAVVTATADVIYWTDSKY